MSDQGSGGQQPASSDTYSDEEAARRRDAVVRRMIATPPTPHKRITPKAKTRTASKGHVHKGKAGR